MDRLTQRDINGIPFCQNAGYLDILQRLAAYEDTGLEPSEVMFILGEYERFTKLEREGRLIVLPHTDESNYAGLKVKYVVAKADTGELVENCFVLRPDKDPAARLALEAYAQATDNQVLASDITSWIGDSGKVKVLPCKVGDTVYAIEPNLCDLRDKDTCDAYCDGWDFSCPDFHSGNTIRQRHFQVEDLRHFGKTVFPSSEEAEAALGGAEGDKT